MALRDPRCFNLFTKNKESVLAIGTKNDRMEELQDLSILFDQAMRWTTHDSKESKEGNEVRRSEIAVGASSSHTKPPLPQLIEIPLEGDEHDMDA